MASTTTITGLASLLILSGQGVLQAWEHAQLRHRDIVLGLARQLAFRINWEKSVLTPVLSLPYLGVVIDFKNQMLLPMQAICQDVARRVMKILHHSPRPAEEWNTLLGKLAIL